MAMKDTDVELRGNSLAGKKILLGVSGGIAAVDTVRLARELRRHGASVSVMMTHSAQKIITPLAVEWATQSEVITQWESDLSALDEVDGILIAPATRDLLASYIHGLQHGPILMSLSAARSRNCPVMMIPSMHADLADDPVTSDLVEKNLEMSVQQVSLVKKQFELGVVKRTDLLKAEVAQGQARVDMLNKKTNLQNVRRILFNDMGLQDFGQEITAVEKEWQAPQIPSSAELLRILKNENPSLLISKSRINLGDLSYRLTRGLRLPSFNSNINYSANSQTSNELVDAFTNDWSLGINLSVSIPIYVGNSLSLQQQQARLSQQQAEHSYTVLLNDLRVQAELIRETLGNYAEIIPLNQSVVSSAEEDLKLVRERYSLGSATILEVLDAQVSLIRSNSNLINIIHDARVQEASLKAVLGTLDLEYQPKEK